MCLPRKKKKKKEKTRKPNNEFPAASHKPSMLQAVLEDCLLDCLEDKLDIISISGTGEMRVKRQVILVEFLEAAEDEGGGLFKVIAPLVGREVLIEGEFRQLFPEKVGEVEEEDEGGLFEPLGGDHLLEEDEGLEHSVL